VNKVKRDHRLIVCLTSLTNLKRALLDNFCRLLFVLCPAPPDEANNDEHIEKQRDENCVLGEAVQFNRPDEHQRQDSLRQFAHVAQRTIVIFFSVNSLGLLGFLLRW